MRYESHSIRFHSTNPHPPSHPLLLLLNVASRRHSSSRARIRPLPITRRTRTPKGIQVSGTRTVITTAITEGEERKGGHEVTSVEMYIEIDVLYSLRSSLPVRACVSCDLFVRSSNFLSSLLFSFRLLRYVSAPLSSWVDQQMTHYWEWAVTLLPMWLALGHTHTAYTHAQHTVSKFEKSKKDSNPTNGEFESNITDNTHSQPNKGINRIMKELTKTYCCVSLLLIGVVCVQSQPGE